ncbi:MAG: methyl-accepting chemotaxis protein [Methylomicrobium sp.]
MKLANLNLFSRFLLWQKFAILGAIAFTLVAAGLYYFVNEQQQRIEAAEREQQGLKVVKDLLGLVNSLPRHRGSSTGLLSGNDALASEEKTTKALTAKHIAAFDAMSQSINNPELLKIWINIKQNWPKIAQAVDTRSITPPENFKAHTQLIAQVLDILDRAIDYYGLSTDPNTETHFLVQAVLVDSPTLAEYLGQARGWGTGLLAKAAKVKEQANNPAADVVTLQDRARLGIMANIANAHWISAERNFAKSLKIARQPNKGLDEQRKTALGLVDQALKLSDTEIINQQVIGFSSTDYYTQYSRAIVEVFKTMDIGFTELDHLFTAQIDSAEHQLITVSSMIIGFILIAAWVAFYIVRSITTPVSHLVGVMQKLAGGDNTVRANLDIFDEIGVLGRQFDIMVDQREAVSAQIRQENEILNDSIIDLLQGVAKLAQRDLTIRLPVAENVTGPVGDALNLLSSETANVLNRILRIAEEVSQVSKQVKTQSDSVIHIAAEEKREVEQVASELNQASETMINIAKLAMFCNQAAEKAIKTTDKAQETVLDTVQGITTIRNTIRETEKRIKRLGERSQEIGSVISIINGIAERTHILALNASMHAASAGEAGRGFAVVANEVQKLAENAREATAQISNLVNNIQIETADTVTTMNDAISQVVQGTTLAQQAGDEMRATRETTANLVQLVQRIAANSKTQAETTRKLQARAIQIQKSTQQTFEHLQDQGLQTERLVDYSSGLLESVGVFILPKTDEAFA